MTGNNAVLIDAYGTYGISNKPSFARSYLMWAKKGGVYNCHVRGGGEKGDKWHKRQVIRETNQIPGGI